MKLRNGLLAVVFVLLYSLAAVSEPVAKIHEIKRPLLGVPAIVKAGDAFSLRLALGDKVVSGATLTGTIISAYHVELALEEKAPGAEVSVFLARVPVDAPDVLYDLTVNFADGASDSQPHSVKVVKEFKKDFDFVHITDIHFNTHLDDHDTNLVRQRLMENIVKLNPEFVLFGGDLGLNPSTYDVDYPYGYEQFVKHMKVAMHVVPGNHEQYTDNRPETSIDGRPYWDAIYGPTYHSFDYGDMHFIGLNSFDWPTKYRDRWDPDLVFLGVPMNANIGLKQWEWAKKDATDATIAGKSITVFSHIPSNYLQGGRKLGFASRKRVKGASLEQFKEFVTRFKVSHVFVGHMHYNRIERLGEYTTEVWTKAAGSGGDEVENPNWGYRVVHVKDGKIVGWDIEEIRYDDVFEK